MTDHLPDVYLGFRARFPAVAAAHDGLAREVDQTGPLDERTTRLVKLGMAVASQSQGAVRSNVRKALDAGASPEEIEHVVLLALTSSGFPTVVAAWQWVQEVLTAR
ncbi:carboxymuconolactone decarboxylase family protein [Actinotalea sp. K2]|uniref:carboxymuconolactone decarboxylase family protein n=1 Tax=Actinotalea sp. K2 TaxID=2939438 RepID=UPI0020182BC3|nr:carboxymuconolactone decarboxylase family protein [Actinotalea sp. K2]MCL3861487.1 carboxymuconolactone decarboxylase family protein [Actinotalea sp. K2]